MFKKTTALVSLVLGLVLMFGALAVPAGASDVTVKATVNKVGTLTLSGLTVDFGSVTPGTSSPKSLTATVQTNSTGWNLTQQISSDFADSNGTKINLSWRQGAAAFQAMGTSTPDAVGSGSVGTASAPYPLDYQLDIPWEVTPADYTANVVYTLSF